MLWSLFGRIVRQRTAFFSKVPDSEQNQDTQNPDREISDSLFYINPDRIETENIRTSRPRILKIHILRYILTVPNISYISYISSQNKDLKYLKLSDFKTKYIFGIRGSPSFTYCDFRAEKMQSRKPPLIPLTYCAN